MNTLMIDSVCEDGYKLGRWIAKCKNKQQGQAHSKAYRHFEQLGVQLVKGGT